MKEVDFISWLYEEESTALYHFIMKYVCNKETAEDIVQEIFCIALRRRKDLYQHPHAVGWLYLTARKIINSEYRKIWRRGTNTNYEEYANTIKDELAEIMLLSVEDNIIHRSLNKMENEIVNLLYVQGYKMSEVAAKLKMKEGTLRVKVLRIRNKLIDSIDKSFFK